MKISFMGSFSAIIMKEEDWYVAKCPEVGTVSQGKTIEEALANLKEATVKKRPKVIFTTFEVASVVQS